MFFVGCMNLIWWEWFLCVSYWSPGRSSRTIWREGSARGTVELLFDRSFKTVRCFRGSLWIWVARGVHDGGNVVDRLPEAEFEEAVEEGLDVLGLGSPFVEVVYCDFRSEVFGKDHAHVGVEGSFVFGRLSGTLLIVIEHFSTFSENNMGIEQYSLLR